MATKHKTKTQLKMPMLGDYQLILPDGYNVSGHQHSAKESFASTRSAIHRNRKITIRTTYRIEIDGKPVKLHTEVLDDGTVHCHGLPNYSFRSALDLARSIIDAERLAHVETNDFGDCHSTHGANDHESEGHH